MWWKTVFFYNEIPNEIRKSNTQDIFKKKLDPAFYDDSKIPKTLVLDMLSSVRTKM